MLNRIIEKHIQIERYLQDFCRMHIASYCRRCESVCCREDICRESMESPFLREIIGKKAVSYDCRKGWLDPKSGCRIRQGRPFVCYEYFCSGIPKKAYSAVSEIIRRMNQAYARVYRGRHILELDDLSLISERKLKRIYEKISTILSWLSEKKLDCRQSVEYNQTKTQPEDRI